MNMVTIPGPLAMCRAPTSYAGIMTTTSACSHNTDEPQVHAMALQYLTCPVCHYLLLRFLPLIGTMVRGTLRG